MDSESRCPVQDGDDIPMWLARLVYKGYSSRYGTQQSLERIIERGGFGMGEVVVCLTWLGITDFSAWKGLQAEVQP